MSTVAANNIRTLSGETAAVETVVRGSVKSWVTFDGTAVTIAALASLNISSLTDLGTGTYQANFATAMADANRAVVATGGANFATGMRLAAQNYGVPSSNNAGVFFNNHGNAFAGDGNAINIMVIR